MTTGAPPRICYDSSRVASGTRATGADGFPEEQRAALGLWFEHIKADATLGIAGRAGLRGIPYLVGFMAKIPIEPARPVFQAPAAPWWRSILKEQAAVSTNENYIDPFFERKILATVYCGAAALLVAKDAANAGDLPLGELATATAKLSKEVLGGSALLQSACYAAKLATNLRMRELAIEAIVSSVDGAYDYAAVDPAAQYSYSPGHAADALDAAANDVDFLVSSGDIDGLLRRPLWPADASTNYQWNIMKATLPQDGTTALWSRWFEGRMRGDENLAPLPPIDPNMLNLKL